MHCRLLALAALFVVPGRIAGQGTQGNELAPGSVAERVVSVSNPEQSYAVFLPTRYDPRTPLPLLCVMDPRGRALVPLTLLRAAAERLGYVIFSSYNTRSDEPTDPNAAAVNAMIADAQRRLAIDTRRIYLVGFSGTARAGWDYAYRLDGHVAGLLGFGAGFPPGWTPPAPAPGERQTLVFFGGAGTMDFNYQEVQDLDAYLDRTGLRHHVASYPGPHGWPPEAVMREAVEWMELQAMRRGLIERDSAWIDSLYRARATEDSSPDDFDRFRRALAMQRDFGGLHDVAADSSRAAVLARSRAVRQGFERRSELADRYRSYIAVLQRYIADSRKVASQLPLSKSLKTLQIARLKRAAADSSDRAAALSAAQLLEQVFVVTAFYEPRDALQAGSAARALALLEVAETIHPGVPFVCTSRKEALEKLGRRAEAAALACSPN